MPAKDTHTTQPSPRRADICCLTMRGFGFVLALWCLLLLTRDFVLSGEIAFWFVAAAGGLGLFAFIASWRLPRSQPRQVARA